MTSDRDDTAKGLGVACVYLRSLASRSECIELV